MRQLTPIEIQRAAILKAARAAIRLKHSLRADGEIAQRLPQIEAEVDEALASGKPFELDPADVFHAD